MITHTVNVGCNGCGAIFSSTPMEYPHVTNAVNQAVNSGWTREHGPKFFCQKCSAKRKAEAAGEATK